MDDRLYKTLKYTAIILTLLWVGWTIYDGMVVPRQPGEGTYTAANRAFEDGNYREALNFYEETLREIPGSIEALRGKARSLMQLGQLEESLAIFNKAIAQEPDFAATYANRGILYDRLGRHHQALADYEKALSLDPGLAEGPGFLTRFLRNQPEKPPTIADRARYLREQLEKPASERLLQVTEEDEKQRPYKYESEEK